MNAARASTVHGQEGKVQQGRGPMRHALALLSSARSMVVLTRIRLRTGSGSSVPAASVK